MVLPVLPWENMKRWDGKPTSALEAQVAELKVGNAHRGSSTRRDVAPVSHSQASRHNKREDDVSNLLERISRIYAQGGNDSQG